MRFSALCVLESKIISSHYHKSAMAWDIIHYFREQLNNPVNAWVICLNLWPILLVKLFSFSSFKHKTIKSDKSAKHCPARCNKFVLVFHYYENWWLMFVFYFYFTLLGSPADKKNLDHKNFTVVCNSAHLKLRTFCNVNLNVFGCQTLNCSVRKKWPVF